MGKSIGIIGNGSQAQRIISILSQLQRSPSVIYKPCLRSSDEGVVDDFKAIESCDYIFLCCPNEYHFLYLEKLIKKGCYIFCEKPPVQTLPQLEKLKLIDNGKVFYNFNLRFSYMSHMLSKTYDFDFGKLLFGSVFKSHGLASKESYKDSWRAKKETCQKGVFEILSVHSIDLIGFHFGIKDITDNQLLNVSGAGTSPDTANTTILTMSGAVVHVHTTYFGPCFEQWTLVFENGIFNVNPDKMELRGPRNSFDDQGFFKYPPILDQQEYKDDYMYSNRISIEHFLNVADSNQFFDSSYTQQCYATNGLLF